MASQTAPTRDVGLDGVAVTVVVRKVTDIEDALTTAAEVDGIEEVEGSGDGGSGLPEPVEPTHPGTLSAGLAGPGPA